MKKIGILFIFLLSLSCKETEKSKKPYKNQDGQEIKIDYANGFTITNYNDYKIIEVNSPWPEAEKTFKYLLAESNARLPEDLAYDQKVTIPVEKIVVTSTTHIPGLEALDKIETLKGFPGLDYISSKETRKLINSGAIKEVGKNESLNTEVLIDLQPDVVIGFAINADNKSFSTIQKTGIPVIYNGEWTESSALGKAEWIKFFGALYNKSKAADSIFNKIESDYNSAKELAKTVETQPTVLSGAMYKDQWYVPYGNSWQAQMIKDANAKYLWADTNGSGSLSLSFESVLDKAQNADYWISAGQFTSYTGMLEQSEHYSQFKAVQDKKLYSVSMSKGETGGVIFYELGPNRPDLILKDLIAIFHPELLENYEPTFFKALND
ncbi:ABC transporter substrate-binding protein [Zunongwangia endophytica]|uniref:ABC transporter substrate-binding protein n=1 Tax=Zunongwangia endophytica TaxID=1808945 RepID=A0ABV8HD87_9FLAO|nr:ABC transporter substrate-binding protein [Zunongwangia endophytica]MDN3593874.1 ABC transporter substrate-binding protein [Zunongwangia endophytica]